MNVHASAEIKLQAAAGAGGPVVALRLGTAVRPAYAAAQAALAAIAAEELSPRPWDDMGLLDVR
jgi:hypothetical protein